MSMKSSEIERHKTKDQEQNTSKRMKKTLKLRTQPGTLSTMKQTLTSSKKTRLRNGFKP